MKKLEKQAMAIVSQLFDLAEVSVDKRQEINDVAYDYVTEQLILTGVSGMFSEKQMEQAWTNGCECGESRSGYFDIENYS